MVRVGSLYNYIDYGKERVDYSGLREIPFKRKLFSEIHTLVEEQQNLFKEDLLPLFEENGLLISKHDSLNQKEKDTLKKYFQKTIYPMLTPMAYDGFHPFPILMNQVPTFGVVTKHRVEKKEKRRLSFVQIPQNLPRFVEFDRSGKIIFVSIEEIIRENIPDLFRNVEIISTNLMRITRNGDFTLEESDDIEADFLEEMKSKLKTRKTGRVVRIEIEENYNKWMMKILQKRWGTDEDNIFLTRDNDIMDYTRFWQIINHPEFRDRTPVHRTPQTPLMFPQNAENIFDAVKDRDILLHHPYNSIEPMLELLEGAAEDPDVLSIKLTIYRLAKNSRVTGALLKAAENGKHVSVLFELKARFDEENNIREAKKLQDAGCFVIYGLSNLKTHTKLLLIVRREGKKVTRYVHMSSGNYNEDTSRLYTDIGLLSINELYAQDISEFFNVITGHSLPNGYLNLITSPTETRARLIELIQQESKNAKEGLPNGIVIKINSLQDKRVIEELYKASQAGVPIKLIVRGICCLRPGRKGLSENIYVCSIVGDYLEHSRLYYFHNNNDPLVYGGSADIMVRSFDRRVESLFLITDEMAKKETIAILINNLKDNVNTYILNEDGTYHKKELNEEKPFNIHKAFFDLKPNDLKDPKLF